MEDRELLQEKDYEISIQSSGKSRERFIRICLSSCVMIFTAVLRDI